MIDVTRDLLIRAQRGDADALEAIISALLPLLHTIAAKLPTAGAADPDDYVSEGVLRILEALRRRRYDSDKSTPQDYVYGYLLQYGRGGIHAARRRENVVKGEAARWITRVRRAAAGLLGEFEREPTAEEVRRSVDSAYGRSPKLHTVRRILRLAPAAPVNHSGCFPNDGTEYDGITVGDDGATEQIEHRYRLQETYDLALRVLRWGDAWIVLHEMHERLGFSFPEVWERLHEADDTSADTFEVGAASWRQHHEAAGLPPAVPAEPAAVLDLFRKCSGALIAPPALRARWNTGCARLREALL